MKRLSLGRETLRHLSETRLRQINGHGAGTDGCSDVYCNTYTEAAGSCLTCYTHCARPGAIPSAPTSRPKTSAEARYHRPAVTRASLPAGTEIAERYLVVERLGGDVYRAMIRASGATSR
jgi:hypothetical protein